MLKIRILYILEVFMKRFILFLLICCLSLSIFACGKDNGFSELEEQIGDSEITPFSFSTPSDKLENKEED